MKTRFLKLLPCLGVAALVSAIVPLAVAQCGLPNRPIKPANTKPMNWDPRSQARPSLVRTAFDGDEREADPGIVGMWHVVFTAQTQNGDPIPVPGGAVIDNSVVVWHPDGTEIMNSARSAQDGNFCLGVWKQTGRHSYLLNHIPWQGNVFDPTVPPDTIGAPQAGAQLIEQITLSPEGDSYTGTFTLHAYDTAGNVYTWFSGTLTAKRITPETPFSALL
jgi:hypothetical protein